MRPALLLSFLFMMVMISSCQKDDSKNSLITDKSVEQTTAKTANLAMVRPRKILVDASKDGGTWWFPQGPGANDPALYHQGQKLANYLRGLGYQVDELSQGTRISLPLLNAYSYVIRAGAVTAYTARELQAYDSLLSRPSSLLLMQDHLKHFPNDMLSEHLNIKFKGAGGTTVARFNPHAITQGVGSIPFTAGSGIINANNVNMTILGYLPANEFIDMNNNNIFDAGDLRGAPVMGILHHPVSKIFFIGDVNGLELVPQPFTANVVKWLFN